MYAYIRVCVYIYIYIYICVYMHIMYVYTCISVCRSDKNTGRNKKPNRTEPNRLILEPAGTGRGHEPNRTEPRRVRKPQAELRRTGRNYFPNRIEPEAVNCSGKVRNRNKSNRTDSFLKVVRLKKRRTDGCRTVAARFADA